MPVQQRNAVYKAELKIRYPIYVSERDLASFGGLMKNVEAQIASYMAEEYAHHLQRETDQVEQEITKLKTDDAYENADARDKSRLENRYSEYRDRMLDRIRSSKGDYQPRTEIVFKTGDKYFPKFRSVAEALASRELDEEPELISYKVTAGRWSTERISIFVSIDENIRVQCSPDDLAVVETSFTEIRTWAEKMAPTRWHQFWVDHGRSTAWILFWTLILSLIFHQRTELSDLGRQVNEILVSGVTDKNLPKAVEILLRTSIGEAKTRTTSYYPQWRGVSDAFGFLLVIVLALRPPRFLVGVKNGKKRFERWKRWIRFATVTVPIFVISAVAGAILLKFLGLS